MSNMLKRFRMPSHFSEAWDSLTLKARHCYIYSDFAFCFSSTPKNSFKKFYSPDKQNNTTYNLLQQDVASLLYLRVKDSHYHYLASLHSQSPSLPLLPFIMPSLPLLPFIMPSLQTPSHPLPPSPPAPSHLTLDRCQAGHRGLQRRSFSSAPCACS